MIRPMNDFVIIEIENGEETHKVVTEDGQEIELVVGGHGGMIERPKVMWGKVIAVGPGKKDPRTGRRIPCDARVGERVCLPTRIDWAQGALTEDGKETIIAKDSQIECAQAEETG